MDTLYNLGWAFSSFSIWICLLQLHIAKKVALNGFDTDAYLNKRRVGANEDAYKANKFNQRASDEIGAERDLPDIRNAQYVAINKPFSARFVLVYLY